jgi:predicted DsbA family dithiol-disulfide isomerase
MMRAIRVGPAAAGMAVACALGLVIGAAALRRGITDDAAFGRKVRAYILDHPEIVAEAAERLRIEPLRAAIETPFAGAWAGNPKGDVTLVMFTDYNCPYCRVTAPEIDRLLAEDPRLKVVWRELPVLGPQSEAAAAAALAAARQGKYPAFHRALFSGGRPDETGIAAASKKVGLDPGKFAADRGAAEVQAEIATNLSIARRLQIGGTPYFVVGNRTFEGAVGRDVLLAAIIEARRGRD